MNTTTPAYESLAIAAKAAARDILRSKWVLNLLSERREYEFSKKRLEELAKGLEKDLAIAAFKVKSATESQDPRLDDYKKELDDITKRVEHEKKIAECQKISKDEEIERINKEIAAVSSGESKVSYETMVELSKELIATRFTDAFVNGDYDHNAE